MRIPVSRAVHWAYAPPCFRGSLPGNASIPARRAEHRVHGTIYFDVTAWCSPREFNSRDGPAPCNCDKGKKPGELSV